MRAVMAFLAVVLVPAALAAHSERLGDIRVGHIWAPPSEESGAAVYVPLMNMGEQPARLVAIKTPIAETAGLREGQGEDTQPVESVELQPNRPVSLTEWRVHIWLDGLQEPLEEGDRFPIELHFEPQGVVKMEVFVERSQGH